MAPDAWDPFTRVQAALSVKFKLCLCCSVCRSAPAAALDGFTVCEGQGGKHTAAAGQHRHRLLCGGKCSAGLHSHAVLLRTQ